MEIPFGTIVDTEFTNAAPGSGLASFFLSEPPRFYMESFLPLNPGQNAEQLPHWKKCADWTEDQQATKVLRHNLIGSAVQLAHILRHLNAHMSGSDIRLHSPSYHSQEPSPHVLETRPPPLATFPDTGYHYHPQDGVDLSQQGHLILTPKRSFSSPVPSQQLSLHDKSIGRPSGVIPEAELPMYPQYPRNPTIEVNQSTSYSNNSDTVLPHHISHSSFSANRGSFSPHDSHQRPYSAGSVHSLSYESDSRIPSFADTLQPLDAPTPSPPLLTTPFYPGGSTPNTCTVNPYDSAIPLILGIPGMPIPDTNF